MSRFAWACGAALLLAVAPARSQVIEFESNGLKFQTLTKSGVTVMFAHLPSHVNTYTIVQAAVANGSKGAYVVRPEDFVFIRSDGVALRASPAASVVQLLTQKGGRSDVLKLVSEYEATLYGSDKVRSTNGYEERRQAALMAGPAKLRAAAAASAVAFVQTRLKSGESTDGAVFFATEGKPLGSGRLVVRTNTDTFEFNAE
jgi:hypothetical protein